MDGINNTGFFIGASASNANCGFVTFQPTGSGNASNRLNLGLYGAPYSISIQYKSAQGFVGINNINPNYQLDINGTVNTSGITTINNNTISTSTATGALVVSGGVGIVGSIYSGNHYQNGNQVISIAGTNVSTSSGILSVVSNPTFSGILTVANTTNAVNVATGSIVTSGGVGVGGNLYASNIYQNGNQVASIAGTNVSTSNGILSVVNNPSFSGIVTINNTNFATSTITGALQILGGIMVNSASLFNSTINMNSNKITNLATPTNAQDAVNKSYVDTATASLSGSSGNFSSIIVTGTTQSISTGTGSVQIYGGLGIGGNIYSSGNINSNNIFQNGNQVFSIAGTNTSSSNGIVSVISNPSFSGIVTITNATSSNNTASGSLIIAGGVGISGSIYSGNQYQNGNQVISIAGTNTSTSNGILSVISNPSFSGIVTINNTNSAISTVTGALQVLGGIMVNSTSLFNNTLSMNSNKIISLSTPTNPQDAANKSYVDTSISNLTGSAGNFSSVLVTGTAQSVSTGTGSVQIYGGLGIGGNIFSNGTINGNNIYQNGNQVVSIAGTNTSTSNGILSVISNPSFSGIVNVTNTTVSSSITSGALIIAGGVGITGSIYASNIFQNGNQVVSIAGTNTSTSNGIISVVNNPTFSGTVIITNTNSAVSTVTGALQILGGIMVNSASLFNSTINLNSNKIINLATPTSPSDSANKSYVDASISNLYGSSGNFSSIIVTGTTQSVSTGTGSVQIYGGLGIGGNIFSSGNINSNTIFQNGSQVVSIAGTNISTSNGIVSVVNNPSFSGIVNITNSTNSSNTATGSLVIAGGIGLSGNLYGSTLYQNGNQVASIAGTNISISSGIISVISNPTFSGIVTLNNTTNSSNTATGSIVISGGLGISGNVYGSNLYQNSNQVFSIAGTNLSSSNGIVSIVNNPIFSGITLISNSTQSSSISTGALVINGGLGIASNLNVGGNLNVTGNFYVAGTTTSISSSIVNITDNLLTVNSGPSGTSDAGYLTKRYQTFNNVGTGDVITDISTSTGIVGTSGNTSTTINLNVSANTVNNYYNGWWIKITSGTGSQQVRQIKSYVGSTNIATIFSTTDESSNPQTPPTGSNFTVTPDNTSNYALYESAFASIFYRSSTKEWVLNSTATISTNTLSIDNYQKFHSGQITAEGAILINNSAISTGTGIGALQVLGGIYVGNSSYFASLINMSNNKITNLATPTVATDASTKGYIDTALTTGITSANFNTLVTGNTTISGTLQVSGNTTISGNLQITGNTSSGNIYQNGNQVVSIAGTNVSISNGIISVISSPTFSSILITNTNAALSSNSGALQIYGGISVNNSSYFSSFINMNSNKIINLTTPTNPSDAANKTYVDSSISSLTGSAGNFSSIIVTGTVQSISTGTGSVQIYGGLGIGGNIFTNGTINGNNIYQNGSQVVSISGTNTSTSNGILSVVSNPSFSGIVNITN